MLTVGFALACAGLGVFYRYAGWDGLMAGLHGGVAIWVTVTLADGRLSPAMRLALQLQPPQGEAGALEWTERRKGFETGELPVLVNGTEVNRILLARIDPAYFRFEVLNRPSLDRDLRGWMSALGANLVVNGSYFAKDGQPSTPTVSNGVMLGPAAYQANHGAFVVSDSSAEIRDLQGQD